VSPDEDAALKLVSESAGKPVLLRDVAALLKTSPVAAAEVMGKLQREGLVTYYLTTGYALSGKPVAVVKAKTEAKTSLAQRVTEGTAIAHRSVGSRMPAPIPMPDAGAAASQKKIDKMKEFAAQRARTRERLRTLAQDCGPPRRPLRTLRA
jgi:hypothetical protein